MAVVIVTEKDIEVAFWFGPTCWNVGVGLTFRELRRGLRWKQLIKNF